MGCRFRRGSAAECWQSQFGGPAWEPAGDGQWYLHLFVAEQPDLNWHNQQVRADFRRTLRFWADRGVDGFRVDVAHGLIKDLNEPYQPWSRLSDIARPDGSHPLRDREELPEVNREWRQVFDLYDPPRIAVAETAVHPTRRHRYGADGLGMAFNFQTQEADWDPADYRRVIDSGLGDPSKGITPTWLLGCHDTPRVATRYGLPRQDGGTAQQIARPARPPQPPWYGDYSADASPPNVTPPSPSTAPPWHSAACCSLATISLGRTRARTMS